MALATETIGLSERNRAAVSKVKLVAILGIVAIETPPVLFIMVQLDVRMGIHGMWGSVDDRILHMAV
ncbi:MAG: hypothetical protein HZC36_04970 [Armatimonadetes bacterium]|nr:hypothetical protein [Armatimonadota bacterium]